jgi:hypothetical protein
MVIRYDQNTKAGRCDWSASTPATTRPRSAIKAIAARWGVGPKPQV